MPALALTSPSYRSTPHSRIDVRGVPVSSCDRESLDDFETALYQFQSYFGDPTATLSATLARDPEFILGHIFMANALLMMSERQYLASARECIDNAKALSSKANERERMLITAAEHLLAGDWDKAGASWDRLLADYPRDALAIQCAHLTDFYLGDAVNLRDRIGRVIGHWDETIPGYSYILGMQAFGLEESNEYALAERTARIALDIERRDGWTVHAVTHVMEMQNRYEEGEAFLTSRIEDWSRDNGFAFHNWWHLALFYLEQENYGAALDLYDETFRSDDSNVSLELVDASALLWRLHLQDQDTGSRWSELAEHWARKVEVENGYYAFNDLHAVIAFVGAGRLAEAKGVRKAVAAAAETNPRVTRAMAAEVGLPACSGMIAYAEGRYADAVECLYPIRSIAQRFGGSNAQRDILTQTLIEAAIRSGHTSLGSNLMHERAVHKPFSPLTRRFERKLGGAGPHLA